MAGLIKPYAGVHPVTQPFLGTYHYVKPDGTVGGEPLGYVKATDHRVGRRTYRRGFNKLPHVHLAQDVGMPQGTDLLAPAAGRVVVEVVAEFGIGMAILFHKDAVYQTVVMFNHLHANGFLVPINAHVAAGQHVAESGATGHVTGPHLHWEIRRGPADADPHYSSSWMKFDPKECLVGGTLAGASWLVPNVK